MVWSARQCTPRSGCSRFRQQHAARLGISRTEFLRRQLQQEARRTVTAVSTADLVRFAQDFPDLADDEVMRGAWS